MSDTERVVTRRGVELMRERSTEILARIRVVPEREGDKTVGMRLFGTRVRRDGGWLRDARGRVVLLRGLDYSGLEFGNFVGLPNGPEEADFAQMASWGVDVVRLPAAPARLVPWGIWILAREIVHVGGSVALF